MIFEHAASNILTLRILKNEHVFSGDFTGRLVFMAANSNLLKNIDPDFMGYEAVIVYHFRHARLKYATSINCVSE